MNKQKQSQDAILAAVDRYLHGLVVELCRTHLADYPKDGFIWLFFARALNVLSRFDEAQTALSNCLNHSPENVRDIIYAEWGHLHRRKGEYSLAEQWYQKGIDVNPESATNYVFLGVIAFRGGRLGLAEEVLRRAIACEGEGVDEGYANLGGVLTTQERYQEAMECYQKALELDPDYKWAKLRLRDTKKVLQLCAKRGRAQPNAPTDALPSARS